MNVPAGRTTSSGQLRHSFSTCPALSDAWDGPEPDVRFCADAGMDTATIATASNAPTCSLTITALLRDGSIRPGAPLCQPVRAQWREI